MKSFKKKISIVILSCYKYRHLWRFCIESWNRELGDLAASFDIYIASDLPCKSKEVELKFDILEYPKNISWFESTIHVINKIKEYGYENILTTFDDLFIMDINKKLLRNIILGHTSYQYIHIIDSHASLIQRINDFRIYQINKKIPYLGTMVMTFWSVNFLLKLLKESNLGPLNAWQFEKKIPEAFSIEGQVGFSNKNIIKYKNIVIKGKVDNISLYEFAVRKDNRSLEIYKDFPGLNLIENLFIYIYYFTFFFLKLILPFNFFKSLSKIKQLITKNSFKRFLS
tara:strand:+ start:205 stop:1056 length:852 start_codon:yes stop_codon:yes gene_type:complete